jgi:phage baseplate assembly protein W
MYKRILRIKEDFSTTIEERYELPVCVIDQTRKSDRDILATTSGSN